MAFNPIDDVLKALGVKARQKINENSEGKNEGIKEGSSEGT